MDAEKSEEDRLYRKVAWRLIPFLIAGYIFAYMDRSNIGFANVQTGHDLGFSPAVFGLGAGLFYAGYSLFELPSNLLLARLGARRTIARIMVIWGVVSAGFAFMRTPAHFYGLRFLLGCAEAGFFPGVLFYLTLWIPAARRARFTALFMSAMALSGLIGAPLSGWIMSRAAGAGGWQGWRWMFVIEAAPSVLMGLASYFYLVDGPSKARWLSDPERRIIQRDLARDVENLESKPTVSLRATLVSPRFYALAPMAVALIAGVGGIGFWLPSILKLAGVKDVFQVGLLAAIPYLVALIVQQWIARRSDRTQERRWHAVACALAGGAGWLMLPQFDHQPVASLAMLTLASAGTFGATAPFWSMPANYLSGTAAAGGIALLTTLGSLGAFLMPIVVGWATVRTGSLDFGKYAYGALLFGGALALWLGPARDRSSNSAPLAR
jgi:MFS family permease